MPKYWTKINQNVEGPYEQHVLKYLDGFTPETLVSLDDANLNEIWIKAAEIKDLSTPISQISISITGLNPTEAPKIDSLQIQTEIQSIPEEKKDEKSSNTPDKNLIPKDNLKNELADTRDNLGKLSNQSLDELTETSYDDIVLHPESMNIPSPTVVKEDMPTKDLIDTNEKSPQEHVQSLDPAPPAESLKKETEPVVPRFSEENFSSPKDKGTSPVKPQNEEDVLASDMLDLMGKIDTEMKNKNKSNIELSPKKPSPTIQQPIVPMSVEASPNIDIALNPNDLIGKPYPFNSKKNRDIKKIVILFCGVIILAFMLFFGYITGTFDNLVQSIKSKFSKSQKTSIQELHNQNPINKFEPLKPLKAIPAKVKKPIKPRKPVAKKRVVAPPPSKKPVVKKVPSKNIKLESQDFVLPGVPSPNVDSRKIEEDQNKDENSMEEVEKQSNNDEEKTEKKAEEQFKDLEWMDTTGWGQ